MRQALRAIHLLGERWPVAAPLQVRETLHALSGSPSGCAFGVAISDSGKLAGPWRQQAEALFADDGGHGFLFHRFDGHRTLHSHNTRDARIGLLLELEHTGETLRVIRPFPST